MCILLIVDRYVIGSLMTGESTIGKGRLIEYIHAAEEPEENQLCTGCV